MISSLLNFSFRCILSTTLTVNSDGNMLTVAHTVFQKMSFYYRDGTFLLKTGTLNSMLCKLQRAAGRPNDQLNNLINNIGEGPLE